MKQLLILILTLLTLAAPIPAAAVQEECAAPMPMMASTSHDMKDCSCCSEKHKACLQLCNAAAPVVIVVPPQMPGFRVIDPSNPPLTSLASIKIAKIASSVDRPPRAIA